MSLYKIGKIWYYDFRFQGHRYKASTGETSKTRAQEVESKRRRELREGNLSRPIEDISFEKLCKKYLKIHAKGKRSQTFYEYTVRVLKRHFEEMLLSEIGPAEIDTFLAARRAEVAPATANRSLVVLKHMFNLGVRWGHLRANPAAGLRCEREANGREFFLTEDQARILLEKCPDWLRPLVVAALHTGARQGELLGLEWKDVDLERGFLTFRQTKNGEPRTVKMSQTVRKVLKDLPSRFEGGQVFRNKSGDPAHRDGITWSFRRAVRLAQLQGFRFHDLRHSAASFMVQQGIPLNTVREILGHRSLQMTLRYAHLAPNHQAEAMAVMDRLGSTNNTDGACSLDN